MSTAKKPIDPSLGNLVWVTGSPDSDPQGTSLLKDMGFDVTFCKNPAKATDIHDSKPSIWKPNIFLVDLIIPGMSGFEIVRRVLQKYKVPVIMLSQYKSTEDVLESGNAGAMAVIKKPLDKAELEELLEKERMRKIKAEIATMVFDINYD